MGAFANNWKSKKNMVREKKKKKAWFCRPLARRGGGGEGSWKTTGDLTGRYVLPRESVSGVANKQACFAYSSISDLRIGEKDFGLDESCSVEGAL